MVGVLFLVARCVDAFTDIGMGRIADASPENPKGRFRVWILRMCGPVALTSFLMYQSALAGASMGVKVQRPAVPFRLSVVGLHLCRRGDQCACAAVYLPA